MGDAVGAYGFEQSAQAECHNPQLWWQDCVVRQKVIGRWQLWRIVRRGEEMHVITFSSSFTTLAVLGLSMLSVFSFCLAHFFAWHCVALHTA